MVYTDGNNFCHIYFTGKLVRDTAVLLSEHAELIGGDVIGAIPEGLTQDQWFTELEKRYANIYDFYGLPELPE